MMKVSSISIITAALLTISVAAAPAYAEGLVSRLTDTVGDTVDSLTGGGTSVGNLVSVGSGAAGNDSLVNIGLGSNGNSPGSLADINLGSGTDPLGNVNVTTGGNGQLLGSNLTAGIDLGGLGLDLTIPGIDDLLGGGGGGGNGGNGGNDDGRVRVGSIDNSFTVNCSVNDGRQALQLASQTKFQPTSWGRAANVQIVPIKLCPQARLQVAQIFNASSKILLLQSAAAQDALIVASLNRTRYDVNDVFAVQASGGSLTVYVY
jgi:hypothetical protein